MLVLALAACKNEQPPLPPDSDQPTKLMIVVDSGKGYPQLHSMVNMLRAEFPTVNIVDFQTAPNAYLADVEQYVRRNPHNGLILIGHSWGASNLFDSVANMGDVRLFVSLDGCRHLKDKPFIVTPNVRKCVNITADFEGLLRATIHGPHLHYRVHGGHSTMTREPETLELVRLFVAQEVQAVRP
jgi:hypothetical protein